MSGRKIEINKGEVKMQDKQILKPAEAAGYIGCKYGMIMELVRQSRIPYYRIGRRVFFKKEALDKWVDEGGTVAR